MKKLNWDVVAMWASGWFLAIAILLALGVAIAYADVQSVLPRSENFTCTAPDGSVIATGARQDTVVASCTNAVNRTQKTHKLTGGSYELRYIKPSDPAPPPVHPQPPKPPEPPPPTAVAIRINVGGQAYTDQSGRVWSADPLKGGDTSVSRDVVIRNTVDPALYLDYRYDLDAADGEISYPIQVPPGKYVIDISTSEEYFVGVRAGPGQRKFGVSVDGSKVITGWDIYADAGEHQADTRRVVLDSTDGTLDIVFLHELENPTIAAIAVYSAASAPPPASAPVPPAAPPVQPPAVAGSAKLTWSAPTTNTDGSTLTDLAGFTIKYGQDRASLDRLIGLDDPKLTSFLVNNLAPGAWYFAIVAYNRDKWESPLSNIASKVIAP